MAIRKKRKPMTPEQRAAAGERLRKAREKRMKENPPQYKNIHPLVMERGEDDPFYFRKIQSWIKTQKEELSIARKDLRQKVKGAETRVASHQTYIRNLENYLRSGSYVDMRYGPHQEHAIRYRCAVPAYDKDGNQKYSYGVFYESLGYTYGKEDEMEEV
jgi:predicted Zn-dependent protease